MINLTKEEYDFDKNCFIYEKLEPLADFRADLYVLLKQFFYVNKKCCKNKKISKIVDKIGELMFYLNKTLSFYLTPLDFDNFTLTLKEVEEAKYNYFFAEKKINDKIVDLMFNYYDDLTYIFSLKEDLIEKEINSLSFVEKEVLNCLQHIFLVQYKMTLKQFYKKEEKVQKKIIGEEVEEDTTEGDDFYDKKIEEKILKEEN